MTNFQVKKTFFKQAVRVGVIVLMFHFQLEAQTTIWSEDFSNCANGTAVESGGCGWATYAITASAHNYFGVTNDVAYRINANNNLTVYGDPAGAAAVYSYDKYQATNEVAYYATKINASAYSALKLNFKWKCVGEGTTSDDHGAVCYSADGTTWTDLTSSLYNQNTTQTVTNLSISTLDLTQFYIGVRWVCDNDVDGMPPIIIDDMSITGTVALPITLIGFKAAFLNKEKVVLDWETVTETGLQGFILERSVDALSFQPIGYIDHKTNMNQNSTYSFVDSTFSCNHCKVLYYRLKQIDLDNNFTYSKVLDVKLINNFEPQIIVMQNPTINGNSIGFKLYDFTPNEKIFIEVYDVFGTNILSTSIETGLLNYTSCLLSNNFSSGVYFVSFYSKEHVFTKKILVD